MITYKKGDMIQALIDGEVKSMAHGVNCCGGFGSGIAGQLAKLLPEVKEKYHEVHKSIGWSLGFVDPVFTPNGIKGWVFNCATQVKYGRTPELEPNGRYCDYAAIKKCLLILKRNESTPYPLGLPKIGCGLAGGDWEIVKTIIEEIFNDSNKEVIIYDY